LARFLLLIGNDMNYLTFIATIIFTVSLGEGVYIFVKNPKSPINRLFFFMTLCLCFWLFGGAIAYSGRTKEEVILFFRISSFGFIFLHAVTLHFSIKITSRGRRRNIRHLVYLIYLPSFYFVYKSWTGLIVYRDFIRTDTTWIGLPDFGSPTLLLLMINYLSYYVLSAVLLLSWRKRTRGNREKKQASVLTLSMAASIFLFNLEPFILPLITRWQSMGLAPLFGILWISGVGYAILKYRFLSWTPELVSSDILNSIDEPVILLDTRYTPVYLNRAAEELTAPKGGDNEADEEDEKNEEETLPAAAGLEMREIINNTPSLAGDLKRLVTGKIHGFSCRLMVSGNGENVIDVKFSLIRDAFDDIQGISLVGKRVKNEIKFRALFSLSEKEMDVLKLLVEGKKGSEIAEALGISLRTVKYHNGGIYSKLKVRNKIELFRMLDSYNLFPEQNAESVSFPLLVKK
jgi:DNA-binding CsgD family transcriptional regulator/PAS domain-containing protein